MKNLGIRGVIVRIGFFLAGFGIVLFLAFSLQNRGSENDQVLNSLYEQSFGQELKRF